jgi:UDP-N-acetylmuramyl pentapeptide synthase
VNFWTKKRLKQALPKANLYNIAGDFDCQGVLVTPVISKEKYIHLFRKTDETFGIAETFYDRLSQENSISAIMCTDYNYFKKYNLPIIEITDINSSLYDMACYKRDFYDGNVIAITGSAGKTTTTKICYDALSKYGACGNLNKANTVFGVSYNITSYDMEVPFWVNEVSLNKGMYPSAKMLHPDVAVITNIAPVHMNENATLKTVAEVKARIFTNMKKGAVAVLYNEMAYSDYVKEFAKAKELKIITFGQDESVDVQVVVDSGYGFKFDGKYFEYSKYPVPLAVLLDMAAVIGIFKGLGLPCDEDLFNSFRKFKPMAGRGAILHGKFNENCNITVMDESYNANPLSMRVTLGGFAALFKNKENKLLILGDMLECGEDAIKYHKELAQSVKDVQASRIILVGEYMKNLYDELKDDLNCKYYGSVEQVIGILSELLHSDEYIFIKGSHSVGLDKLVKFFELKFKEFN